MKRSLLIFCIIVMLCWVAWFEYTFPDSVAIIEQNWPISLTMVFGSFIAGATSEGGGAVAFPVFTKLLNISPYDAKIFSLAIQSVGMTAAAIAIVLLRIKVSWQIILWASLGGVAGVILGGSWLAFLLAPDVTKMSFTAMVSSFAVTLLILRLKKRRYIDNLNCFAATEKLILLAAGFMGGIMSGLVGNGIDIICFSVLVLLFRIKESVATPTSVILMAINALFGACLHVFYLNDVTPTIQNYWLAAIPVVIIGAPLGVFFCSRLSDNKIALVLIGLILIEFISSVLIIPLNRDLILISSGIGLFFSSVYYMMAKQQKYIRHL